MKRKIFSILFALVLVVSFSLVTAVPAAAADTIIVGPNSYTSIQMAIDAANDGDTIIVEAATYYETIAVTTDNLIIQSVSGDPSDTIIDAGGADGNVVAITDCSGVTLSGFTIKGGTGGIHMYTATGCSISNVCITDIGSAGGIFLTVGSSDNDFSSVTISNIQGGRGLGIFQSDGNTFESTKVSDITGMVAGIWLCDSSDNSFVDTEISDISHAAPGGHVEGIYLYGRDTQDTDRNTFTRTTISGLTGEQWAIALRITGARDNIFSGFAISDLTSNAGRGMWIFSMAGKESSGNSFTEGSITGAGYGLEVGGGCPGNSIHYTNIVDSIEYGACSASTLDATNNWWGSASGPTHASNTYTAPGDDSQGDAVSDLVDFVPWLGGPYPSVTSIVPVTLDDPEGQFSSIQAAINAATGTTITCIAGTYNEEVNVGNSLTLLGAQHGVDPTVDGARTTEAEESIIDFPAKPSGEYDSRPEYDGALAISADGVTVDGFTITRAYYNAIFVTSDKNTITNNILSHNGYRGVCTYGSANTNTITNNAISNNGREGIYLFEDVGGTTIENNVISHSGRPGIYVSWSDDNTIEYNDISYSGEADSGEWVGGITLNGAFRNTLTGNTLSNQCRGIALRDSVDNTLTRNTISNNDYGIYLRVGVVTGNVGNEVHYNNIVGNTEYGVYNCETEIFDATFNWWGDVTGPEQATTNPDGKGNKVSDNVYYIPWLTRNFETVLTEGIGYYGFPMVELGTGWNLLSTPFALDPGEIIGGVTYLGCNTWAQFVTLNDLPLYTVVGEEYVNAYYFDGDVQKWGEVTGDYVLLPCDAIYVRMASPDIAAVLASPQRWMPTKTLYEDWNLVGLSWMPPEEQYGLHAKLALKSVEVVGSLTGYTLVVSPWANQQPWTYIAGTDGPGLMLLTKGYWVFMENGPDVLAGFWPTPMGLP